MKKSLLLLEKGGRDLRGLFKQLNFYENLNFGFALDVDMGSGLRREPSETIVVPSAERMGGGVIFPILGQKMEISFHHLLRIEAERLGVAF